ncbi:glycoside hydrolase family 13 protein [Zeaxanthinibacter sp. PT1]|uniref:glycoside hydrolase family 13 protein n=1 Tax=Zeaxanthinibacter TaxID=561554 RepID=UPI00234986CB|nr:glycoside hydrolase family 13 protein [Zeaxanthinibacter sp. PT1]MDC6351179.1 glycoside hydrolase family 13 protein [Zeaxanthinibacter sp. PT1]
MSASAQEIRVEPPNWWVGFKDSELQLMLHGPDVGSFDAVIEGSDVTLIKAQAADSPNYLFLDLNIGPGARAGKIDIVLKKGKEEIRLPYLLNERVKPAEDYVGFDSSDVIYLITPDRFANGDPSNDKVKGLKETKVDRKNDYGRHGGDIRGIINHLDYIDEMGFTAIWSSPLLINDMPNASYHGYAMTDFYLVDPRFGTLQEYKELAEKSSERGIKLIMDQVANHIGVEHWWMKDLPFKDWIHYQEGFENGEKIPVTNHRRTVNQDPYAAKADVKLMDNGWFVTSMPDLNQDNPFMATYLIQNSLWWIETLGLGGIRQDTYPYPDKEFMSEWAGRIMTEYPNFNIVGEEWSYNPLLVGYWQSGSSASGDYESNLKTTMDFPLQQTLVNALKQEESWDKGFNTLYEGLANDFYYHDPKSIMIFGDNHDMDRLYTQLDEDAVLTKMALAYILTVPRIPQLYYGTEILMENSAKPGDHGLIRTDFPGGWKGDKVNAFNGQGLSDEQKDMQQTLKKLLNFRKGNQVLHQGETRHFAPEDAVYTLFRTIGDQAVVLFLNKNDSAVKIPLQRYSEMGLKGKKAKDVISGEEFIWNDVLQLDEKGFLLLTL